MFAIGDKKWPGVSKLIEEISELGQVLGKLMGSRGETKHWSGDLLEIMHDEIGDALAAINFVIIKCGLDRRRILARCADKMKTFERWHQEDPEQ